MYMEKQNNMTKNIAFKNIFLIIICIIALSATAAFASAKSCAYIVRNSAFVDNDLRNLVTSYGYNITTVYESNINRTNLSNYTFLIIDNDGFTNAAKVPVNEYNSLILTDDDGIENYTTWNWTTHDGTVRSYLTNKQAQIQNTSHYITQGLPANFSFYTVNNTIYVHYMSNATMGYLAPGIRNIITIGPSYEYRILLATVDIGGQLHNYTAKGKEVFLGIDVRQMTYWTTEDYMLFNRTLSWLATDFIAPSISNVTIVNRTNSTASINWTTNKLANTTLIYGTATNALTLTYTNSIFTTGTSTVTLTNLNESTQYYFKITSCNVDGYCNTTALNSFTTLDQTYPQINYINVSNRTNSSATIDVNFSEPARYNIYYGLIPNGLYNIATQNVYSINSSLTLANLAENTLYYYMYNMCDNASINESGNITPAINCGNSSIYNLTTADYTAPGSPGGPTLYVVDSSDGSANSIKVTWDAPSGEPVARYNIYISTVFNVSGFNFSQPNATTTLTEYNDTTGYNLEQAYYIVRAEDAAGNEENNTAIAAKFALLLYPGYNLVSIPFFPYNSDINAVMHQSEGTAIVSEVRRFNTSTQKMETSIFNYTTKLWENKTTTTRILPGFNTINPYEGYFFRCEADEPTYFNIVGAPKMTYNIDLVEGMNLIGLTMFSNKTLQSVLNQSLYNNSISEISERQRDMSYKTFTYYNATGSWIGGNFANDTITIQPGVGYWLKAKSNVTIMVSP